MANIIAQEQKVKLKSHFLYLISSNLLNVHVCIAFLPKYFFFNNVYLLGKIPQGKYLLGNVSKDLALIVRSCGYTLCE